MKRAAAEAEAEAGAAGGGGRSRLKEDLKRSQSLPKGFFRQYDRYDTMRDRFANARRRKPSGSQQQEQEAAGSKQLYASATAPSMAPIGWDAGPEEPDGDRGSQLQNDRLVGGSSQGACNQGASSTVLGVQAQKPAAIGQQPAAIRRAASVTSAGVDAVQTSDASLASCTRPPRPPPLVTPDATGDAVDTGSGMGRGAGAGVCEGAGTAGSSTAICGVESAAASPARGRMMANTSSGNTLRSTRPPSRAHKGPRTLANAWSVSWLGIHPPTHLHVELQSLQLHFSHPGASTSSAPALLATGAHTSTPTCAHAANRQAAGSHAAQGHSPHGATSASTLADQAELNSSSMAQSRSHPRSSLPRSTYHRISASASQLGGHCSTAGLGSGTRRSLDNARVGSAGHSPAHHHLLEHPRAPSWMLREAMLHQPPLKLTYPATRPGLAVGWARLHQAAAEEQAALKAAKPKARRHA